MGVIKGTSTITGVIPFAELYERLLNLGRIDSPNNSDYAKGIVNDAYTRTLPRLEDWEAIITNDWISVVPTYITGTLSVAVGGTTVTGVGTTWTSAMTSAQGYKMIINGNRDVYQFDYIGATSGTITPALSGPTDMTGRTYRIVKDEYDLAANFDRFLRNGSIYVYSGGRVQDTIKEVPRDMFQEEILPSEQDPIRRVLRSRINPTTNRQMIRVNPYPKEAYNYPYEYIKKIPGMYEYRTETVAVTNGSAVVTGTDTFWSTNISAGDYFRIDANGISEGSIWYKIASVDTDEQITLEVVYGESTESLMEYTMCDAPNSFQPEFHEFILYDGLVIVTAEQGDPNLQGFAARREEILGNLRKNYKGRRTNVQFRVGDDGIRSGRNSREDDMSYRR